ncbi:hypothetical protein, partial [Pseudomonas syringae group genomosp. 7]|uniref:hypothetical protein n=1 Tax=Pseudomonas syringae group genomosp. 7 TaxID=251699 RepID=UPI0037703D81
VGVVVGGFVVLCVLFGVYCEVVGGFWVCGGVGRVVWLLMSVLLAVLGRFLLGVLGCFLGVVFFLCWWCFWFFWGVVVVLFLVLFWCWWLLVGFGWGCWGGCWGVFCGWSVGFVCCVGWGRFAGWGGGCGWCLGLCFLVLVCWCVCWVLWLGVLSSVWCWALGWWWGGFLLILWLSAE